MVIFDWIIVILPLIIFYITKNKVLTFFIFIFLLHFMWSPNLSNLNFNKDIFYSPSSGYIRDIKDNDNSITISLFLGLLDNHTQYTPIKSKLIKREYLSGNFIPAYNEHAINNRRVVNTFYNEDYDFIYTITQITGILTRRIKTFDQNIYLPGDRLGFIIFGSRVDINIPKQNINKILVTKGTYINALTPLLLFQKK